MVFPADSGDDLAMSHDINVTPFIDVILVLLIIFMVAAPLATVDVPVDLPRSTAQLQPRPDKPIFVTLKADRSVAINDGPVSRDDVGRALDAASSHDREKRLFVRADSAVSYGEIMQLMNLLRTTGYTKIALVALESPPGT
ncbi:TonB system transport protein ExbD [Bradyrhizobium sp. HKCCYLS3077]|uniref:TonB system transport protein ExbD n=1 Tax=Bradyrhizobium sp. HKCCYLS3077 TaxID=3420761 RepID=UPI003EB711C9